MDLVTSAAVAGAAVPVVGGLVVAGRWAVRRGHRLEQFLGDWFGEEARPGVPARPGVMTRLETIEARLGVVEAEVRPNHGSSMRDAVDRIEGKVTS